MSEIAENRTTGKLKFQKKLAKT